MQTAALEFETSKFDDDTDEANPGLRGRALAEWLAARLREEGVSAGEVFAEDFGFCVPITSRPHALFVACGSAGGAPGHWSVFAFAKGGVLARVLGRDRRAESAAEVMATVRRCLEAEPGVRSLREAR